tara:strand:+ start:10116 stop:11318 length:1203 start_codon:yes stop_codon:yes gene_type:complete
MNKLYSRKPLVTAVAIAIPLMLSTASVNSAEFDIADTKVTVGGYAKFMLNYDTDGTITAPFNGDLYSVYTTPIDGSANAEKSDLHMTARESRLFIKTASENKYGTLKTYVEGDFFADIDSDGPTWSNSNGFRIRHAYGEMTMGKHVVLAGQTWSNFMDFAGIMPSMDFATDPGTTFVRQPQVRYQYNIGKGQYTSISLENPTLGLTAAGPYTLVNNGSSEDVMPDIIAKYFYANSRVTFSPRVVIRRFELEGDDAFGYGLALNTSLKFGDGHKAVLGLMYGDGIGRYAGLGFNAGAGINADGETDTLEYSSITGGVVFALQQNMRLAIGAGYSEQDEKGLEDGILTEYANKTAFSWHTNLFWNITPDIEWAVGVTMGDVENMADKEGDMTRFQTYVKYTF